MGSSYDPVRHTDLARGHSLKLKFKSRPAFGGNVFWLEGEDINVANPICVRFKHFKIISRGLEPIRLWEKLIHLLALLIQTRISFLLLWNVLPPNF